MTNSVIETFSYPLEEIEIIKKAKDTARRNGLSFSAYVMELLKEESEKNGQSYTDPLNLSRNHDTANPSNDDMSYDIYKLTESEAKQHVKDCGYDTFMKYTPIAAIYVERANLIFKIHHKEYLERKNQEKYLEKIHEASEHRIPYGRD